MRTILLCTILFVCSCAQRPVSWTPELVEATQRDFKLEGTWRHAVRSGADFGKTCDLLFDTDGTYRKACKPPYEERGDWKRVGDWDGHTFTVRLVERFDIIEKKQVADADVVITVESPDNNEISLMGETYERM